MTLPLFYTTANESPWLALFQPSIVYQQKPAKCGCVKCKEGGHGLYWNGYFTNQRKTHCVYVGKEKREINPIEELEK